MVNLEVEVVAEGFPERVTGMALRNGHVVGKVVQQDVTVEALQILDAAPTVAAEGHRGIVFNRSLSDDRLSRNRPGPA